MADQPINIEWNQEEEHFIPITEIDLVSQLSNNLDFSADNKLLFKRFCKLYISLYHAKFFARLQGLKNNYLPFSPDRATLSLKKYSLKELNQLQKNLIEAIQVIVQKANYTQITKDELNHALAETSPYGLDVSVNFDDFEEIHLYYRGLSTKIEEKRSWSTLYQKIEKVEVPIYRRLFLVLKLKNPDDKPTELPFYRDPKHYFLHKWRHLFRLKMEKGGDSAFVYLKLFKDIPKSDLEMLFPNTRVEVKRFDKVTMGVSGGGGIIGGMIAIGTKIAQAANPMTIFFAVAGFGGIIWREIGKVISSRNRYMATLAKSLYFHNLDNNLGVLSNLIEMAEAQECKESILTYGFLSTKGKHGCSIKELDHMVENYLSKTYSVQIDFELHDGIRKLQQAGLLEKTPDERLKILPLEQALQHLDREWDEIFSFGEAT